VASLVLGLASFFCLCVATVPGLICGAVGLSNIGKSNGRLKGRGMAITGILLSLALPLISAIIGFVVIGKQMATNPDLKDLLGAGVSLFQGTTQGTEISAALKAHADGHQGRLPSTMDELVTSGALDAPKLASPVDGSANFWHITQPGALLTQLPVKTVIARSRPIRVRGESMEVVIFADGTVKPQESPRDDGGSFDTSDPESIEAGPLPPEAEETAGPNGPAESPPDR